MSLKEKIDIERLPNHVAIIMDGNGRWAKSKGKERFCGHQEGVESVRVIAETAAELGIQYLTLYAFSKENWNRPTEEVNALMNLLVMTLESELETFKKNGIKLDVIGDIDNLPQESRTALSNVMAATESFNRMTMVLALSYSARWEIVNAIRNIAIDVENQQLNSEMINEKIFTKYLTTCNIPDPELLIRTSGEYRISNFLLWQLAYTELFFSQKYWPEFRREEFYEAVVDFQGRERRFGKTSEQIKGK
ncbi:MAG: isoprenyl transferase [Bacteroidales bacterium]|nr:isoprenyl transferase [Bacteroidales bacterium]